ncbi:MAG: alpha/beta hydrolase [Desulfobacteraceae bacterium]|jgi:pimeloyl-ACP methyl ester carboxylesterase
MKISNHFVHKLVPLLLVLVMFGCASLRDRKQEVISTVLSADDSPISFAVKGIGEPTIVFVHCWTCNHKFWKHQIEYFSEKYKVIWLDLAGHGMSGSTRSDYTMEAFGEDVAAVVNKVAGNRIVLVGHSMGGPVSIEAAKILGDKVVAVVGVDTFYTPFQHPKSEAEIEEFVKPFEKDFIGASQQMVNSMFTPNVDPELKASIVKQFSGENPEMGISAMYEIFRWSVKNVPFSLTAYSNKLRNINAAPTGNETALHEGVTLIPGVGHFVPQVKPEEFNDALSEIIREYQR